MVVTCEVRWIFPTHVSPLLIGIIWLEALWLLFQACSRGDVSEEHIWKPTVPHVQTEKKDAMIYSFCGSMSKQSHPNSTSRRRKCGVNKSSSQQRNFGSKVRWPQQRVNTSVAADGHHASAPALCDRRGAADVPFWLALFLTRAVLHEGNLDARLLRGAGLTS